MEGDSVEVRKLLSLSTLDPNIPGTLGYTPFIWACYEGHGEVVKAMLEFESVAVDRKDELGRNGFGVAALDGHAQVLRILLEFGLPRIDPNSRDCLDKTALILASSGGHKEAVDLLLKHRSVDNGCRDIAGRNAFDVASEKLREAVPGLVLLGKDDEEGDRETEMKERVEAELEQRRDRERLKEEKAREAAAAQQSEREKLIADNARLSAALEAARKELGTLKTRLDSPRRRGNLLNTPKVVPSIPVANPEWNGWIAGTAIGLWIGAAAVLAMAVFGSRKRS